jgi:peptidoglycan DL-endopeptidase CwlO
VTPTAYPRRRRKTSGTVLLTVLAMVVASFVPGAAISASAANPAPVSAQPDPNAPNENGSASLNTLRANLAAAAEGYMKAESELAASKAKQAEAQQRLEAAEADAARIKDRVADFAAETYRNGRIGPINMLLRSNGPADLLSRAQALESVTQNDMDRLAALADARRRQTEAKAAIDSEVATQTAALQEMAKRKTAAERALAAANDTRQSSGASTSGAATARPAPRNPDGSWPPESCSVDDPTTSGCITPRTLHALNEAKRAGFTWYVSCYRPGTMYEHPKGRACDFAAFPGGFENRSATGENRNYGDRLAAFFVKNASALAVMYIVWYCQIWQYGIGWHRYNSAGSNCGDAPAGDHTNHVHLSVY